MSLETILAYVAALAAGWAVRYFFPGLGVRDPNAAEPEVYIKGRPVLDLCVREALKRFGGNVLARAAIIAEAEAIDKVLDELKVPELGNIAPVVPPVVK
jgi:hypothetical protein